MIDRLLRRLSVRQRITGSFISLVALIALLAPLILAARTSITDRLTQISQVESKTNRLLLLASGRVESSRVNLLRYLQDYAPSAYEATDDAAQATRLLQQAYDLMTDSEQKEAVAEVLAALDEYQNLIHNIETARTAGEEQTVSHLLFQTSRLGNNISSRIEQIVADSEAQIEEANREFLDFLQNQILVVAGVYLVILVLAMLLAFTVERSITRPIADLTEGANAFRRGDLEASVPVVGSDELALLGQTLNEMAAQIQDLIGNLERRVAERTRDLENRAVQLATAAEVGRAAASILDREELAHRVVNLVQERFNLYYVALFLIDPEGEYAVLQAGSGPVGRIMEAEGHKLAVGGDSMVGQACALRQPRIALDVAGGDADKAGAEPVRFDNPLLPETRAELALPLIVGDEVLGALDVQDRRPNAFSEPQIAVLQLVADQVAVALQNAQLFAQVEMRLERERRLYGEISREAWAQILTGRSIVGYYGDERGIVPLDDATLHETEPSPSAPEAQSDETAIAFPIVVRDQIIGIVEARKPPGRVGWTERELALLETLVGQLGAALDSARLYEDTQRRAVRDRLLSHLATRVRETLDVETVLRTAALEVQQALDLPEVVIRLINPQEESRHA